MKLRTKVRAGNTFNRNAKKLVVKTKVRAGNTFNRNAKKLTKG